MKFPDQFRLTEGPFMTAPGNPFGAFIIPSHHANGRALKVIADSGQTTGWEHASVSIHDQPNKTPSRREMCLVKDLFWDPVDCVIQYHPAAEDYVNVHPGCLHLWRPTDGVFPTPPGICV